MKSRIQIPGCEVIPVPLFHVLDGKNSSDYVARVEPSASGGKKIAHYLLDIIDNTNASLTHDSIGILGPHAPMMTPLQR